MLETATLVRCLNASAGSYSVECRIVLYLLLFKEECDGLLRVNVMHALREVGVKAGSEDDWDVTLEVGLVA